ncbi:MAG: NADPH-dependent glutamate synthase [Chloroflexi bacterium]|nr:NADPH-dependent glutamate synthase [Chloroflexota bacterium]
MPMVQLKKTPLPALDPIQRRLGFQEVSLGYSPTQALAEAQRCLLCQEPNCEAGCPVGVPIRDFIKLIAEGKPLEAVRAIKQVNSLPAICGRVCPQEHQCELKCVIKGKQEPVAIGALERFVADYELAHQGAQTSVNGYHRNLVNSLPGKPTAKVAVVGSGPASLTAAGDLARTGYHVTLFEALHVPGGVLMYGIPEFRLPKSIVAAEINKLREQGVEIQCNTVIGRTITIDQLMHEMGFGAVFIGSGAGSPKFMGIPGENLKGVYSANEFLTRINLMKANRFPEFDTPVKKGQRVVVVGAGDTAMDVVRTAIRVGAREAYIVYRRTEKEMTARIEDYHHAAEEGALFQWLTNPVRLVGSDDGWVRGMECIRMELGSPDESGRRRPLPVAGSEFLMEVDTVVMALGTNPNPTVSQSTQDLVSDRYGHIKADPATGATSKPGVFAGGDVVTGSATVILAAGAGKRSAQAIHQYLNERRKAPTAGAPAVGC